MFPYWVNWWKTSMEQKSQKHNPPLTVLLLLPPSLLVKCQGCNTWILQPRWISGWSVYTWALLLHWNPWRDEGLCLLGEKTLKRWLTSCLPAVKPSSYIRETFQHLFWNLSLHLNMYVFVVSTCLNRSFFTMLVYLIFTLTSSVYDTLAYMLAACPPVKHTAIMRRTRKYRKDSH